MGYVLLARRTSFASVYYVPYNNDHNSARNNFSSLPAQQKRKINSVWVCLRFRLIAIHFNWIRFWQMCNFLPLSRGRHLCGIGHKIYFKWWMMLYICTFSFNYRESRGKSFRIQWIQTHNWILKFKRKRMHVSSHGNFLIIVSSEIHRMWFIGYEHSADDNQRY